MSHHGHDDVASLRHTIDVAAAAAFAVNGGSTISAKTISATKYTASLFGVIVSILLCYVHSPYLEFERETVH